MSQNESHLRSARRHSECPFHTQRFKGAAFINANFHQFKATVAPDSYNTDRRIAGSRFLHRGKGRLGNKLTVIAAQPITLKSILGPRAYVENETVYTHNAAQTYRTNHDVIDWILRHKNLASNSQKT